MRALLVSAGLLLTFGASGQDPRIDENLRTDISRRVKEGQALYQPAAKPNEIKSKNVTYSGIAVQVVKTDRPLHLINPAAPAQYGSAEDNVARDPITGKVSGLKLFAISF
jgi:hypothetical protein